MTPQAYMVEAWDTMSLLLRLSTPLSVRLEAHRQWAPVGKFRRLSTDLAKSTYPKKKAPPQHKHGNNLD
jgi:hypothetical protein